MLYCYGCIFIIEEAIIKGRFLINKKFNYYKTMPRFNGTGPSGSGSGTGWGMGPCGGGQAYGRRGGGRGKGFGWRRFWGYYPAATPSKKEEKEILEDEISILEDELKVIKARLVELKGQK